MPSSRVAGFLRRLPVIAVQPPVEVELPASGASITVEPAAGETALARWHRAGEPLVDVPGLVQGSSTTTLRLLSADPSLLGEYDVVLTNACGITRSSLTRVVAPPCIGDHNADGGVDGVDVEVFYSDWEAGLVEADVNRDGGIDGSDIDTFFVAWEAGC